MNKAPDLSQYGINVEDVVYNAPPPQLYKEALIREPDALIADTGALVVSWCCSMALY